MFGSISRLLQEPNWVDYALVASGVIVIIGSAIYYAKQNRVYQIEFYAGNAVSFKNQVEAIVTTQGFYPIEVDEHTAIYKPNTSKAKSQVALSYRPPTSDL